MTATPYSDHRVSALIRATLFVQDLDRAVAFYGALGLTETYYSGILEDASACALLGFKEVRPYPIRILKRPGPNFGMIGLFQLTPNLEAAALPAPQGPARLGEVALVFYVVSMSDTVSRLREVGATWLPEPQIFRMPHREQAEVCLRDCDGVLINLVETDPAQQLRDRPELDYA